jgi:hypothetical protein
VNYCNVKIEEVIHQSGNFKAQLLIISAGISFHASSALEMPQSVIPQTLMDAQFLIFTRSPARLNRPRMSSRLMMARPAVQVDPPAVLRV